MSKQVDDIVKAMKIQFDTDIHETGIKLAHYVGDELGPEIASTLNIPDTPRHTKSMNSLSPSNIVSGMDTLVDLTDVYSARIKFWNIPLLEQMSLPTGGETIPIWSMLNWGSGPKAHLLASARGANSISTSSFLSYQTKLRGSSILSKPPSDKSPSEYVWWRKIGKGDRKEGFYILQSNIKKIESARRKKGKKAGVATQPMAYYTPQFYIEKSASRMLGKLKTLLAGTIKKSPIQ